MINLLKEDYVRCVWLGAMLPFGETGKYLINYFKEKHDVDIEYLEEVKTLPGYGPKGGRFDQIFNVYLDSLDNFDAIKHDIGAQYAKDIVREGKHRLYNERIFHSYFKRSEDELVKDGELTDDDRYHTLLGDNK